MASCPCGCGRSIGFMKRRLAQHAVDLEVAFDPLERLEHYVQPDQQEMARSFRQGGEVMADVMLQSAHGEEVPPAALPTMSTLNGWRRGANASIRQLHEVDRAYLEHYIGTLPPDGQRLVRSMLKG